MIQQLLKKAGEAWCAVMHEDITLPRHGVYRCRKCHREYRVPWAESTGGGPDQRAQPAAARPRLGIADANPATGR